jgi:hypothetical protein
MENGSMHVLSKGILRECYTARADCALRVCKLGGTQNDFVYSGLLPKAFSRNGKGTREAPPELNNRNRKDLRLVRQGLDRCSLYVGLEGESHPGNGWTVAFEYPFLESSRAKFPLRAFWLPGASIQLPWSRYLVYSRGHCSVLFQT